MQNPPIRRYDPRVQDAFGQLADIFFRGGWVMWPLLLLSVVSVAVSLERAVFWARLHGRGHRDRMQRYTELLRAGKHAEIRKAAGSGSTLYEQVAQELADRDWVADAAAVEFTERFRSDFDRFTSVLATIVTASPLLGILGTVLGIIRSFEILGSGEAIGDISGVAAGIAEALITTAFGLIVALVSLFPWMVFRAQADRCIGQIERLVAASISGHARTIDQAKKKAGQDAVDAVST